MPATNGKVWDIYINLKAEHAELKRALGEAGNSVREFSRTVKQETTEAKHSIGLLGEEIGVRIPRELRGVIAQLPGVAAAINTAFGAIAVVAFAKIIFEAGQKIAEFIKKNEEAASKNQEAWTKIHSSIETQNDDLELTKVKLENAIAKLEHKPENKLAQALAEARVEADKLSEKVDSIVKQIGEAVKGQVSNGFSQLFLKQTGGTKTADVVEKLQLKLSDIENGYVSGDKPQLQQQAIKDALGALAPILKDSHDMVEELKRNGTPLDHSSSRVESRTSSNAVRNLQGLLALTTNSQQVAGLQQKQSTLQGAGDANKKRGEMIIELIKMDEFRAKEQERITSEVQEFGSKLLRQETQEQLRADKEQIASDKAKTAEFIKGIETRIQAQRDLIADASKRYQDTEKRSGYRVKLGQETEGQREQELAGAALQEGDAKTAAYQAIADLLFSIGKGASPEAQKNADDALRAEGDSQEKILGIHAQYSEQIRQRWMEALGGINNEIANLMTGQKTNWTGMFRGQAHHLATSGLQGVEKSVLGKLGIGGKADGSSNSPFWVRIVGAALGAGGADLTNAVPGSGIGGFFKSIFGGFLGGHAFGGAALAGVPIPVGELGPETFVPSVPGTVVPHNQMSSGFSIGHIDARGTDPALTQANVYRAVQAARAGGAHDATHAMYERSRRTAQG